MRNMFITIPTRLGLAVTLGTLVATGAGCWTKNGIIYIYIYIYIYIHTYIQAKHMIIRNLKIRNAGRKGRGLLDEERHPRKSSSHRDC